MRISHLSLHAGRFVVVASSDDDGRSTFAECWGAGHPYDARAVGASDDLGDAMLIAENTGRYAQIIDRRTGRPVGQRRLKRYLAAAQSREANAAAECNRHAMCRSGY